MMGAFQKRCLAPIGQPRSVLIVEDDRQLTQCLARAMEARGFNVATAESVLDGLAQIKSMP
jgi:two-component system, response regulator RegA